MRLGSATHESLRADHHAARQGAQARSALRAASDPRWMWGERQIPCHKTSLEDVFLEIQSIHEKPMTMEEVVGFVMNLAMEKIPAESGAILFADVNGRELYFATARGPKAWRCHGIPRPDGTGNRWVLCQRGRQPGDRRRATGSAVLPTNLRGPKLPHDQHRMRPYSVRRSRVRVHRVDQQRGLGTVRGK